MRLTVAPIDVNVGEGWRLVGEEEVIQSGDCMCSKECGWGGSLTTEEPVGKKVKDWPNLFKQITIVAVRRKVEKEQNMQTNKDNMSCRWVLVSEGLPTLEGDYQFSYKDNTFYQINLGGAIAWCQSYPEGLWFHVPPAPPIKSEEDLAFENIRDAETGRVIKYLAIQFPATVGHLPLVEKLDGIFNAGIEFARKGAKP